MKLWHSLNTCLMLLLSCVHASPVRHSGARTVEVEEERPLERPPPPVRARLSVSAPGSSAGVSGKSTVRRRSVEEQEEMLEVGEKYTIEESLLDDFADVADLIKVTVSRIQHSSPSPSSSSSSDTTSRTRHRRAKKRAPPTQRRRGAVGKRARGGRGKNQGCVLRQVQLNVTDLALGYRSSEEMIFRYCAGPCRKSETNYDKILSNLVQSKRLPPKERPAQACCRPVAFDDDLSFLDDNLIYHTMRKHSARKCACV